MQKQNTTKKQAGSRRVKITPEDYADIQRGNFIATKGGVTGDLERLALAIAEIYTNRLTPVGLFNQTVDYLSSNSGDLWGRMMIEPSMIEKILVEEESTRNKRKAEREEVADAN